MLIHWKRSQGLNMNEFTKMCKIPSQWWKIKEWRIPLWCLVNVVWCYTVPRSCFMIVQEFKCVNEHTKSINFLNPYAADQIFVLFHYMPGVTKLTLLKCHMLPGVTKVLATKMTQSFPKFANIFNILNLLWIG